MRTNIWPRLSRIASVLAAVAALFWAAAGAVGAPARVPWTILSTTTGALPPANGGSEQTSCVTADVDGDGATDFFITERSMAPAVILYRRQAGGWQKCIVEAGQLAIDAGGDAADIDGDGDLDVAFGQDFSGGNVWWWENPGAALNPSVPWVRRLIKSGGNQHHDQRFGDFDGDGQLEFATWVNLDKQVEIYEVPADPTLSPWPRTATLVMSGTGFLEGMDVVDVDLDGKVDILAGGHWIRHAGGTNYTKQPIDATYAHSRMIGAQFVPGGYPEVVMGSGDADAPLSFYTYDGTSWLKTNLLPLVIHGHSLEAGDFDGDGHLDIFTAEMGDPGAGANCRAWIAFGDGIGNFSLELISTGIANHMSRVADLDGDGDLDIVMKPYHFGAPRVEVYLNEIKLSLDDWQRYLIDGAMPWQPLEVTVGDMDGDAEPDIIAGGWWYKNPGSIDGVWGRNPIGASLNNMAWVHDFDGDGDLDVFGTDGIPDGGGAMRWARNNGYGTFTIFNNVDFGQTVFFQGAVGGRFAPGDPYQVVMQWQGGEFGGSGVEAFTVPADPVTGTWTKSILHPTSVGEGLSKGDIDGDGDLDLFQGGSWLRHEANGSWTHVPVASFPAEYGGPDRNILVDIDRDGDLDAAVGFSHFIGPSTVLLWLEHPADPTQPWPQHQITDGVWGGYSLDAKDIDLDGDIDIVLGEHRGATRALIYENINNGASWIEHLVDAGGAGIDHHVGTKLFDLDGDGDLDIVSIGWDNDKLWIFENTTAVLVDTEPPTVPTNLIAVAVSSVRINLNWSAATDNRSVTGYRVYRDGVEVGSTSNPTYSDTGLASETPYTYTVRAFDVAGNLSAESTPASATTPVPDTIPPTVPGGLTATPFSTQIILAWNASADNLAVAGYRIYRDGVEIATTTNLHYTDAGLPTDTNYNYQVSAFDAEGNASDAAQSAVSATTRGPLLLGYPFEEGAGSAVFDASGNQNQAVLEGGAVRTPAGRFGEAIAFNGSDSRVNLGNYNPGGPALTWALWFKPDDFDIADARLISKAVGVQENDHYFMVSTLAIGGGTGLRFRLKTTVGGTTTLIGSGPALQAGVWTHVAVTYDGAEMRLYQNGVQIGSTAKTGALVSAPTVATWLGANPDGSRHFDGTIDEVRNYNVALSVGEIQALMGTPMPPATGDTEAPTVPTGLLAIASSASAVTLTWSAATDNAGVTGYRIHRDGVEIGTSTTVNYTNGGLAAATTYNYQVSAFDAAANFSVRSASAFATTHGTVSVTSVGQGAVTVAPAQPSYVVGTDVQLSATPESGWQFSGWSGDVNSAENPLQMTVSAAHTLTATFTNATPQITSQPAAVTVTEPTAAAFSVTATGAAPLAYQWRRNGADIGGATGSSYTLSLTAVAADNGAQFSVVVTNTSGSVTSTVATLTVEVTPIPPMIVLPPAIIDGQFTVRFAGVPGRTYTIEGAGSVQGPWSKIVNLTAPGTDVGFGVGVFEFREAVRGTPARFYRASHLSY